MNLINIYDLKPGQVFTSPVYSEGEYLLVPQMVPLRQKDIDFLVSWGIEEVRTEGTIFEAEEKAAEKPAPAAENNKEKAEIKKEQIKFSIIDVKQNSGPYRAYKNLIEKLNFVFTEIKSGVDVDIHAVDNICDHLLNDLHDYRDNYVDYILGGEVSGHELAKSSVNTAILSALMAQEFGLTDHKIPNIVVAALLHDVGMLRLSKGITEKKGGLSEAETEQIKSHPVHTSKIIAKELFGPHEVELIALQHHERWDGNGYPNHINGPAIDIGARIVSVADAFEAMVSKKSYRNSLIGYQAIKNLMADNARRFDPAVIHIFTKIMGIYPIGSIVELNNGSVARVISVHTDAPMRPIIQMLMDENGKALDTRKPQTVDLLIVKTLYIKNAIDPAYYNDANK
jgi:HD-GYP domain-containing protein (c-di-GMP phosphodiesterase class II)